MKLNVWRRSGVHWNWNWWTGTLGPAAPTQWSLLVLCNVMNRIYKRTDTAVAFTQDYSRVSYPLRNMSTLSTGSGSSKDTHAGVEKTEERTFYILNLCLEEEITSPLYFELKLSTDLYKPKAPK